MAWFTREKSDLLGPQLAANRQRGEEFAAYMEKAFGLCTPDRSRTLTGANQSVSLPAALMQQVGLPVPFEDVLNAVLGGGGNEELAYMVFDFMEASK